MKRPVMKFCIWIGLMLGLAVPTGAYGLVRPTETAAASIDSPAFGASLNKKLADWRFTASELQQQARAKQHKGAGGTKLALFPFSGAISACIGSGCLLSGCGGSACLISGCGFSGCLSSGCIGSGCGGSACAGSVCGGSACKGSVCGGSDCRGSVCGGSSCNGSVCGGSGCMGSVCARCDGGGS